MLYPLKQWKHQYLLRSIQIYHLLLKVVIIYYLLHLSIDLVFPLLLSYYFIF
nr:MAG TPA: hypothetical protein [Caudoviricetes sp.]